MASDVGIARRAVEGGFLAREDLKACQAERRELLKQGIEVSLRELLFERGLLDEARWHTLRRELDRTRDDATRTRDDGAALDAIDERLVSSLVESEETQGDEVLGGYRILGELGRGAMGVVYEALQLELERRVALKILPETQALRGEARERFQREARATAALKHPGIVPIYDVGAQRGVHFFAMELVEGESLEQILQRDGPFPPEEAARLVRAAAEAIEHAHDNGVIHRDVKPDNILLRADGSPVLTDFGLARSVLDQTLTRDGAIVGTPLYMAPEQATGEGPPIDRRVDVYALGVTLFRLAAGRVPFDDSPDTRTLLDRVVHEAPPNLRSLVPAVPAPLADIVEVALEKDPADRFQSAGELAADLGRFLAGEPIEARPPPAWVKALRGAVRRKHQLLLLAWGLVLVAVLAGVLHQLSLRWRADSLVNEAVALGQAGQRAEALARLAGALELWPGLAEARFRQGELHLQEGREDEALLAFDQALDREPDHRETLLLRGELLRRRGQLERALEDLLRAVRLAGEADARPAIRAGLTLAALDRGDEAADHLRRGLEQARRLRLTSEPGYADAVLSLGSLELARGDAGAARAELEEAARLAPDSARPRVLLTRALLALGRDQTAMEVATEALGRAPEHLEARELRGRAFRRLGRYPEACVDLEAAAARPSARLMLGLVRFEALDLDESASATAFDYKQVRTELEAALEGQGLVPAEECLGRVVLAWLSLLQERPRRSPALRELDRAIELAPTSALARLARASLLLGWKRPDDAAEDLRAASALEGAGYAATVGLARAALAQGDPERARRLLDQAIELEPARTTAYADRYRLRHARGEAGAEEDRRRALRRLESAAEGEDPQGWRALAPGSDPLRWAEQCGQVGMRIYAQALSDKAAPARALAWAERALVIDSLGLAPTACAASALHLLARDAEAEAAYARARRADPRLLEAELMRGVLQRDLLPEAGPEVAERTLRAALAEAPAGSELQGNLRYELALALVAQGREDPALDVLDEALQTSERACVAGLYARLACRLKRPDAEAAIDRASRLFYEGTRDRVRGRIYLMAGSRISLDHKLRAEHFLTRAIEADPLDARAWRARSRVRWHGSPEQFPRGFIDDYIAAELDPRFTIGFMKLEARLARFRPVIVLIAERVDDVLREAPELPAAAFMRGYLSFFQESYREALPWFDRAIHLSRDRSYFSFALRGATWMRLREYAKAEADLDRAEELFPGGPVTAFWRAALEAARGEPERAVAILEQQAAEGFLFRAQLERAAELAPLMDHPRIRRLLDEAEDPKR